MVSTHKTMLHTAASAIVLMACLLMPCTCPAQSVMWTWMSGSDRIDEAGVYGTQGVPDAANAPGARYDSSSWTDASGDLWLFGGEAPGWGLLNDLWRYDTVTGEWTWMSGSSLTDQFGVYGTRGVPDAANVPGARAGAVSWIDSSGDLWLFGGRGFDRDGQYDWLNDLWRYDTAANQWAWEDGLPFIDLVYEKGFHNDKGYPRPDVWPGAREGAISWIDSFGFMWLFGGYGYQDIVYFDYREEDGTYCWDRDPGSCPKPGALNDLWVYNKATHEWAWVSGSSDRNKLGSYGAMGAPAFGNMPGARWGSIPWIDEDNNLWLFGGAGKDNQVSDDYFIRMNDLWNYNPVTKMWTWVSGSATGDTVGVYDESNGDLVPGCREESISWIDNAGKLWLFGGFGLASTYSPIGGLLNDLWSFDNATKQWDWVSGSDEISTPGGTIIAGIYGTRGVPDEANVPGAREGTVSWIDSLGTLWLFGGGDGFDGYGDYGYLNDLWRFGTIACVSDAECDDGLFCNGDETCTGGACVEGTAPCSGDTPVCDEDLDLCVACSSDDDCGGDTPFCDTAQNLCVACLADGDCDDSLFCNGAETCTDGACGEGTDPCQGATPVCDEAQDICTPPECTVDGDCDDGLFCNGPETCADGSCADGAAPCGGDTPICDEADDTCVTGCLTDDDCGDAYTCQANVCVPKCNLLIKYKQLVSAKLTKDKKVTFKITTGAFGPVDMGPDIRILEVKPNTKKGTVKVKTIVPAGLAPQTIPVWVGDCFGQIVIQ